MRNLYRVTAQCGLVAFSSGALIGFSTVLERLNEVLTPAGGGSAFSASHGTNAYALSFILSGVVSLVVNRYGLQRTWLVWALLAGTALATALALLFSAVSVDTQEVLWLYLAAVPFMSVALGGLIYCNNVVAVGQWVKEGKPQVGAAVVGGTQGLGTLAFTVLPGVLIDANQELGLYWYALVLVGLGLLGLGLAAGRWFRWPGDDEEEQQQAPPSPVRAKADLRVSSSDVTAGDPRDEADAGKVVAVETVANKSPQMQPSSVPGTAPAARSGKVVVTTAVGILSTLDGLMYATLYVLVYFAGIGAKGILTAMFLLIFPDQVDFLYATVLATVSLVLYAVVRVIFPFFVKVVPIHLTFGIVNLVGAVLFGILPWLLSNSLDSHGFTAILAVTGAVYAIGATLLPLVGAVYFEGKLFPLAAGTASALSPFGSAGGILMSWYLGQINMPAAGQASADEIAAQSRTVFNPTFYMFAMVYVANALILLYFYFKGHSSLAAAAGGAERGEAQATTDGGGHADLEAGQVMDAAAVVVELKAASVTADGAGPVTSGLRSMQSVQHLAGTPSALQVYSSNVL